MKKTSQNLIVALICGFMLAGTIACTDNDQQTEEDDASQPAKTELPAIRENITEKFRSSNNLHLWLDSTGTDFYAAGNEPFWILTMDFDRIITFKAPDGEEIKVPPVEPVRAQDADVRRYRAMTEAVELIIQLRHTPCTDSISGQHFDYTVTVEHKRTGETEYHSYDGCGVFRRDPRIHNIWVVEEVEGQRVAAGDYIKGIPTLEFSVGEGRILGHDGCNNVNGSFEMELQTITFSPLSGTLMSCPNAELSAVIGRVLSQQTYSYVFSDRLELRKGEKVMMRLRNVD